jgi:cytidine deaminase
MLKIQEELLNAARDAARLSYSPYSQFRVGAAVFAGGNIYQGANIENASANLGICAERVALAHARMHQAEVIEGLAIYCRDDRENKDRRELSLQQCLPCGACLQWLAELAPEAWIVTNASPKVFKLADLLPLPFKLGT